MSGILNDERRKWMKSQGWEVALVRVCRETNKIIAVGYRWTGPPEEPQVKDDTHSM